MVFLELTEKAPEVEKAPKASAAKATEEKVEAAAAPAKKGLFKKKAAVK
jgi:hypothetical protein